MENELFSYDSTSLVEDLEVACLDCVLKKQIGDHPIGTKVRLIVLWYGQNPWIQLNFGRINGRDTVEEYRLGLSIGEKF